MVTTYMDVLQQTVDTVGDRAYRSVCFGSYEVSSPREWGMLILPLMSFQLQSLCLLVVKIELFQHGERRSSKPTTTDRIKGLINKFQA
jgi:hypothetical protein